MKFVYKFVNGEKVELKLKVGVGGDVDVEFETKFSEFKHAQKLVNRKESRRHESLSLFDKDAKTAILKQIFADRL